MSAQDIGQYLANFHSVDFPNREFGEEIKVPTLESMFEKLPNQRYLIELKPEDELTADTLCALVIKSEVEEQVIVGSFHSETLKYFRDQCPKVPTSIGQTEMVWLVLLERLKLGHLFKTESYSIQVPVFYGGYKILSPSLIDLAHSLNMRVDVWTVNSPEVMKEVISMGVDGVITDYPDRLISILTH
jgi:glycerophosphoryl diester phosphodiesterase